MPGPTVIFYDSGLGGLSHVPDFLVQVSCPRLVYFADSVNFPYGRLPRATLEELILSNVAALVDQYDPCMLIVACNTASVSALAALRRAFPALVVVGTVPAIKLAAEYSQSRRIGVIATERTIAEPYIHELAARHAPDCLLETVAAGELVDFVETRYLQAGPKEREDAVRPALERCLAANCDALVLACTHFIFLADEFEHLSAGRARVFDSREGVARRAASLYRECYPLERGGGTCRIYLESALDSIPASIEPARRSFVASVGFDHMERVAAFCTASEIHRLGVPSGEAR